MDYEYLDHFGWSRPSQINNRYHVDSRHDPSTRYVAFKSHQGETPWRLTKVVGNKPVGYKDLPNVGEVDHERYSDDVMARDGHDRGGWTPMTREARVIGSISRASDTVWR
jgi:hypothetical protein